MLHRHFCFFLFKKKLSFSVGKLLELWLLLPLGDCLAQPL